MTLGHLIALAVFIALVMDEHDHPWITIGSLIVFLNYGSVT